MNIDDTFFKEIFEKEDFKSLSVERKDELLKKIILKIEDFFILKARLPDAKFGYKKGIYKKPYDSNSYEGSNITPIDNCTYTECMYACDPPGTDDTKCLDPSCNYPTSCQEGCKDTGCTENEDRTCDNWCTHPSNGSTMISINECVDSDKCTDMKCGNGNSPEGGWKCRDENGCEDYSCRNEGPFTSECIDQSSCTDSVCCNRNCFDNIGTPGGNTCGIDGLCANGRNCTNSGSSSSNSCIDNVCFDSGQRGLPSCKDEVNCADNICTHYNQCTDSSTCTDTTCNDLGCNDLGMPNYCTDSRPAYCTNGLTVCIDAACPDPVPFSEEKEE